MVELPSDDFLDAQNEVPNADTIAAIQEVEEMKRHPEQYKVYDSFEEILQEVLAEMEQEKMNA